MRSQIVPVKKVVEKVSRRGNQPRKQKRKGQNPKSGAFSEAALQQLASVVAQQHQMLKAVQASPLGPSLFKSLPVRTEGPDSGADVGGAFKHVPALFREGRSDLGDLGDGVDRSIKAIRRMLNVEVKAFQAAGTAVQPTTTGTVQDFLSGISQGITDAQRIGDSIKILRVRLEFMFEMNSTAAATQAIWVMICRANDEIMTAAQLNTVDANAYAYLGQRRWDNKDQYRVLWERRMVVDPEHQAIIGTIDLKLNDHVQYEAAGNVINSGSIFLAIWSNSTTNNPNFGYVLQVEYVDN